MLEFREIDRHNFRDILKLSTTESQKFFVATNAYSLSQAYAQPECVPLALYDGDTPVGFTMYGLDVEDTEYWIYRLMIDQRHQSKGYGRQALAMVLPGAGPCTRVWASAPTAAWSTGRLSISWCGNRNFIYNKRKRAGAVPTLFFAQRKKTGTRRPSLCSCSLLGHGRIGGHRRIRSHGGISGGILSSGGSGIGAFLGDSGSSAGAGGAAGGAGGAVAATRAGSHAQGQSEGQKAREKFLHSEFPLYCKIL